MECQDWETAAAVGGTPQPQAELSQQEGWRPQGLPPPSTGNKGTVVMQQEDPDKDSHFTLPCPQILWKQRKIEKNEPTINFRWRGNALKNKASFFVYLFFCCFF